MSILCENIIHYNQKYDVRTLGYVFMPNHFHSIILFAQQNRISDYLRDLKRNTSNEIRNEISEVRPSMLHKLEFQHRRQIYKVWSDRFNSKVVYTTKFLQQKLNYIHNNPLQAHWKLAVNPEDYRYSSAAFYTNGIQQDIPVTHYGNYFSIPVAQ
jgi:putative transposase